MPAPRYKQPEPGHEFSAIEVETYAGQNPNDYLNHLQQSDFKLQMPDNTRLRNAIGTVPKKPALLNKSLTPGDRIRGWITFQTPQGEKPKCVVYSRKRIILKWSMLED